MVLTPEEQHYFTRHRKIIITGSEGGRYEVRLGGDTGNIRPLQTVKVGIRNALFSGGRAAGPDNLLCAHPKRHLNDGNTLPLMDSIATQVLTIKANEKHFLRTAFIYL
jgi:hypothetical protein